MDRIRAKIELIRKKQNRNKAETTNNQGTNYKQMFVKQEQIRTKIGTNPNQNRNTSEPK